MKKGKLRTYFLEMPIISFTKYKNKTIEQVAILLTEKCRLYIQLTRFKNNVNFFKNFNIHSSIVLQTVKYTDDVYFTTTSLRHFILQWKYVQISDKSP